MVERRRGAWWLGGVVAVGAWACCPGVKAAPIDITPADDFVAEANALEPGEVLQLAAGEYVLSGFSLLDVHGTAAQPIVIRSAPGADVHVRRLDDSQNLLNIAASHLVIEGIRFSGGSVGLRLNAASDLTLRHIQVHDTAEAAVTANISGQTYARLRIEHSEFHHTGGTGEGLYLGCNSAACAVVDSTVRGNWIHHTNGAMVTQGEGIDLKLGSHGNLIADNVIHDTLFPGIVVADTAGGGPANRVERNLVFASADRGVQVTANAIVANNIVIGVAAEGIAAVGSPVGNLVFRHNTVWQPGATALRLSSVSGPVQVHNNALYADAGFSVRASGTVGQVVLSGNVGQGSLEGVAGGVDTSGLATDFVHAGASPLPDLFPAPGGKLVGAADPAALAEDDFNRSSRANDATVGAYAVGSGGNPGGALGGGLKLVVEQVFADGFEPLPPCGGSGEPACPTTYVIGFCRLQFPNSVQGNAGDMVEVYGRVYIAGLTDTTFGNDAAAQVRAWTGHGPDGSDPSVDPNWSWTQGAPNPDYDALSGPGGEPDNDEYVASMKLPLAAGSPYDFAFRFSGDGGASYTYCDGGAAGSADGYQPANAGHLEVF